MEKNRPRFSVAEENGDEELLGVAVIGVGSVGKSLARSLSLAGYRITALVHRSDNAALALASSIDVPVVSPHVRDIPANTRLVFICTHESDFQKVIGDLLESSVALTNALVAHVSGQASTVVLNELQEQGAMTLSFHPLGSFVPLATDKLFRGLTIGLEGSSEAVAVGHRIAADLGATAFEIPPNLKPAYHLAAVMTSNFVCTIMGDVQRLLEIVGLPKALTHSLAEDTLNNLAHLPAEQALSGPIVRGDTKALQGQIEIIKATIPDILETFLSLARANIALALRGNRISRDKADKMIAALEKASKS